MPAISESKYLVQAGWGDVPHLDEKTKAELLASTLPHERDARSLGKPALGQGAIYPIEESEIVCDPFVIPPYFRRAYGLDVGWNKTAAIWGAHDLTTDVVYLYTEHYRGQAEPSVHAAAIRARGDWIPGVIDPASRGRQQADGEQLIAQYREQGLVLTPADHAVDAGLWAVYERLSTGRLKVFRTCLNWLAEYRLYRRDEKGKIVKQFDHLMDACVVGDTMVETDRGPRRISDLVGREGRVVSRCGAMASFIGARLTIADAEIVRVRFADGREVFCTPDHPFLTPDGWVQARDMAGRLCYDAVSQRIHVARLCGSRSYRQPFKSLRGFATTCAESISSAVASACIAWFGKGQTAVRSLRAFMCTITMRIGRTISPIICACSPAVATSPTTRKAMGVAFRIKPFERRGHGTAARRAASGTVSTTAPMATRFMSRQRSSASTVESGSPRSAPAPIASAPTPARRGRAWRLALTMKNVIAWFAAAVLWRIATLASRHARANVGPRCLSVTAAGRRDVYCLTVPGTSAFAIEGGLVVHNTRYLILSGLSLAVTQPVKNNRLGSAGGGDGKVGY